ncbi:hypothetical protein C448_08709 [Halococcus morrhuae DSM 1307]|uniref:FAD-binding domain-containing protein n=1 Tax=Halococcus morrhuae DSM 1307 TaxID=931277 RepID=M0MF40_HALMO|nr:FAD-dependent monooxygenase [Halococcus morrhuae]EMA44341.1 hypothetical protein C448_08709 [Halococcus morrhuae DSM 1307]
MADVAIIGAGIGGLCTAIGLQNRGFDPIVFERTNELRPVGFGIGIGPNGMQALNELGVADAVIEQGVVLDRIELRTEAGQLLMPMDFRAPANRLGLDHVMVAIHRADLQSILVERLSKERLRLGVECEGIDPEQPAVQFAAGNEKTANLVVGADGIDSTVREHVLPGNQPRYAGEVAYRGLVDVTVLDDITPKGMEFWGRGLRFGYFPVSDEQVYWFASIVASRPGTAPEATASKLAERYRKFVDPIPDLIARTNDETLLRTPLTDLPRLTYWTSGRVALLGDAAHAMTPNLAQGSAQAMEDAIVLADSIATHGTTRRALADYEARRKERAESVRRQSRIQGRLAQIDHPTVARIRNTALRYVPSSLLQKQTKSLIDIDF